MYHNFFLYCSFDPTFLIINLFKVLKELFVLVEFWSLLMFRMSYCLMILTENGDSLEIHCDEWTAVGDYSRSRWAELGSVDSSDRSSYVLHKSFEL